MLLALAHEDKTIHFVTFIIFEIIALEPAIGHSQDTTNLVVFWGLKAKINGLD